MIHTEWATATDCSPNVHERGIEVGEHVIDREYGLTLDTGSGVVVIEGTGDELSDLLTTWHDYLNQYLGMRDGYDHHDRVTYDEPPF